MKWFEKKGDKKQVSKENPKKNEKVGKPQITKQENQDSHIVREKKIWNLKNIFIAFWIFVLFIVIAIVYIGFFPSGDKFENRLLLWTILTIIYAIILFFLLEPGKLREIERKEYKTIEKRVPVVKEVVKTVEKPVERVVYKDRVRTVEKPVIREVEKPVYYPVTKPKKEVKKYAFVGSKLTKIYHKSSCRLGRSIKKKYKAYADDEKAFTKQKYKPCKICVLKERKV